MNCWKYLLINSLSIELRSMVTLRQLTVFYYDPSSSGGYRGAEGFYREAKKKFPRVTRKQTSDFLAKQDAYTIHKQINKPKKHRRVYSKGIGYLWMADLLDFQAVQHENRGYRFVCCVIDVLSKLLWTFPLLTKRGVDVTKALRPIFKRFKPKKLCVDRGREFYNKSFKTMLAKYRVKMYSTHSDKKASVVERVQRTLRNRLGKLWTKNQNQKWYDFLPQITKSYNSSYHRTIKMAPIDVKKSHEKELLERVYPDEYAKKRKLKVGDHVRITKYRKTFEKEYTPGWTTEVFKIKEILSTVPVTYILKDLTNEDIDGGFYFEEIQKIDPEQ